MPRQKKEKTQEDIDRNNLLNYFISICCEPINYAVYNKQLKEIKQQYKDYTYKGMQYCLWYIHEHQKIPIKSIAIVPYYYEESKKYYQWLCRWYICSECITFFCIDKSLLIICTHFL